MSSGVEVHIATFLTAHLTLKIQVIASVSPEERLASLTRHGSVVHAVGLIPTDHTYRRIIKARSVRSHLILLMRLGHCFF